MVLKKHLLVISCEVFFREVCYLAARSPMVISLEFIRKKMHNDPQLLREEIQSKIDAAEGNYDAIVIAFGLCGMAIDGLQSHTIPLIIPRVHDCNALLLGSIERYNAITTNTPGTLWASVGYLENRSKTAETDVSADEKNYLFKDISIIENLESYIEKYGEENGHYIYETLNSSLKNYEQVIFIDSDLVDTAEYKEKTRSFALKNKYAYKEEKENLDILKNLLYGNWEKEQFLIVPPGLKVAASYDDTVIKEKLS